MIQRKNWRKGFTIVELLIVIVIIGILAAVTIVTFNGVQKQAIDKSVLSDADGVSGEVARYATKNNGILGSAIAWYSGDSANANIKFTPSTGNIIDVVASKTDYCIRAYNPNAATYMTLATAAVKESNFGACTTMVASSAAQTASPATSVAVVASRVSAGGEHSCAIRTNQAYCWGYYFNGRLGINPLPSGAVGVPTAVYTGGVLSGKSLVAIGAGGYSSCALDTAGKAYCWGYNNNGQLGNNSTTTSTSPVAVTTSGALSGKTLVSISVGRGQSYDRTTTCALDTAGKAYCWGYNSDGQLGNNSTGNSLVPVAVSTAGVLAGKTLVGIAVGYRYSCALDTAGKAYCWGDNFNGQLGTGDDNDSLVPVAVTTAGVLSDVTLTAMSLGENHSCAIGSGAVYCWGSGSDGKLGRGSTSDSYAPVATIMGGELLGKMPTAVAAGQSHSCVVAANKAYCWGNNGNGQLGNSSTTSSSLPVAVTTSGVLSGKSLSTIATGQNHTCVEDNASAFYCWGSGSDGKLGNGSFSGNFTVPVAASF